MLKNNSEGMIDQNLINEGLENFCKTLFQKSIQNINDKLNNFLNEVSVPCLSNKQPIMCKNEISEKKLLESLKNIDSNKTPVNDGLTK